MSSKTKPRAPTSSGRPTLSVPYSKTIIAPGQEPGKDVPYEAHRALERYVASRWGRRSIESIERREIRDLIEEIVDSGKITTANRVRAYLSAFFNWCLERDVIDATPMQGIKPRREVARERVLSDDEIRWLWMAAGDVGEPWGPLARFLLLTGARLNEAAQMLEEELSGDVWELPADRSKNGRAHSVPLAPAALAIVRREIRVPSDAGLMFTTNGTTPVQGFTKGKAQLARRMELLATAERGEPVEIPHWTWHDLRRSMATGLARIGIPVRITEACLNHVSGSGSGIVAVYQRHDFGEEKRTALEAWARYLEELIDGRASNVTGLSDSQVAAQ